MRNRIRGSRTGALFVALALTFTAAACGGDDDESSSPTTEAGADDSTTVATDPSTTTSAPDNSTDVGTTGTDTVDTATRVVDTPMGEVEIPAEPQRIAVLWGATLSSVVELGFDPIAAFGSGGDPAILEPYLPQGYPVDDLALVAEAREVNFEALAAAEPDLILGGQVPHLEEAYDTLSEVAPTVLLTWDNTTSWRTMLTDVGDVLDVADRASTAVDNYEAHVAEVRDAVDIDENPLTVSVVRVQSEEEIRVETPESFAGQVLTDVGFDRPDSQVTPDADADYISLSLERIPEVDAPTIIALYQFNGETAPAWESLRSQPLWQALPAVQAGDVIEADFTYWASSNYYAAHRILDDLAAAFSS